ncbi:ThuA domain-containing protein [Emticicia sp. 21SJ11W-3]|uniref:ThuA domain-containing protein n=1 Tax=Emticicia sp. 21SJ11W-3 TaxID=2916755 RepID=UPI00209F0090|nr:ThuA domain-containing protein [Emticicia sp. 21SJ11W-3]UTA67404.1 ThuA domain-containing protein [Emticicia sp. 21SJ11W-3]
MKKPVKSFCFCLWAVVVLFSVMVSHEVTAQQKRVLVFSKTKGWRHSSIPFGKEAIKKLGVENNFSVDISENSDDFNDANLKKYSAVIFNSTTGNVLNNEQQAAFERYIQSGGGFVGIHAAADTEYEWPWYGQLVGAYFESHPNNSNVRKATVLVTDKTHISTTHLPDKWDRTDEWYNYKSIFRGIKPLAYLDESTYDGGTNGGNHPMAWYHEFDGGRSFYTGGGHTDESFSEPLFLKHLLGGITFAMGGSKPLDYEKAYSVTMPEENRFEKTVLVNDLNNPMELAVSNDGKVYFTELAGNLSVFNTQTNQFKLIHRFPVVMKGGTGVIGITLDPDFDTNRWLYLYYSPPIEGEPIYFNLSRFKLSAKDEIDLTSEKILLRVPVQINSGSHHGGSLAFDKDKNLILSTGDGTTPFPSNGYAPLDERSGAEYYPMDAQRSAANTNDYKGKILRIHPLPDGTYTIPAGNLFKPGEPNTLPEIYAMGCRNPYRIAINPKTGTIYWGEIGPDAGEDSPRGPRGYDEFNQAKKPGNFGWPYFVGNNYAYSEWDFTANKPGPHYNPAKPVNNSPNNTGLKELPPATPPMIWYPYALSPEFPELGTGGRSAMAGEFYTFNEASANKNKIPRYYDGALFIFDWMRNWMLATRLDKDENYVKTEAFMPTKGDFRRPIDLAFSKDGIMYVLEYGSVYGADNKDARLVKIEYNYDNRAPLATASIVDTLMMAKKQRESFITSEIREMPQYKEWAGKAPLKLRFSGRGTDLDFDDKLSNEWYINGAKQEGDKPMFVHTFTKSGNYKVVFLVKDLAGKTATDTLAVRVGNGVPVVKINAKKNKAFYWDNQPFEYAVSVNDAEDKVINAKKRKVEYNYYPNPYQPVDVSKSDSKVELGSLGKTLVDASDCKACHTLDKTSVGPSFLAISKKYGNGDNKTIKTLSKKIIDGGGGSWGSTHVMSAHPQLSAQDADEMVKYILAINDPNKNFKPIATTGSIALKEHQENKTTGYYTIKASYIDNGTAGSKPEKAEDVVRLRYHELRAMDADRHPGFVFDWGELRQGASKAYLVFKNIDLTNINTIAFEYASQDKSGVIEVRENSVAGPVIARTTFEPTQGWGKMKWVESKLDKPVDGFRDLYIIAVKSDKPSDNLIKFKTLRFN